VPLPASFMMANTADTASPLVGRIPATWIVGLVQNDRHDTPIGKQRRERGGCSFHSNRCGVSIILTSPRSEATSRSRCASRGAPPVLQIEPPDNLIVWVVTTHQARRLGSCYPRPRFGLNPWHRSLGRPSGEAHYLGSNYPSAELGSL
jgi:hypothetical protein